MASPSPDPGPERDGSPRKKRSKTRSRVPAGTRDRHPRPRSARTRVPRVPVAPADDRGVAGPAPARPPRRRSGPPAGVAAQRVLDEVGEDPVEGDRVRERRWASPTPAPSGEQRDSRGVGAAPNRSTAASTAVGASSASGRIAPGASSSPTRSSSREHRAEPVGLLRDRAGRPVGVGPGRPSRRGAPPRTRR